jgi:myo-inositol 2-dehydrogenase / D-chiro-inositol 1-dehydrogenase
MQRGAGLRCSRLNAGIAMALRFGLLGAGRIGQTHARAVASLPGASIAAVFDPVEAAANAIRDQYGAKTASVEAILADKAIDAVLICTPTDLHADQIEQAARAGKAIFCEKPIDLSADRVRACLGVVAKEKATLMIGFNRRFDPNFAEMRRRIESGAIGAVEMVQITSRDPAPPPLSYIARSGGLFRDMMIHDFDMARFMLGEEVTDVFAVGSSLVDPAIGQAGDVDSATATLRTASGKIALLSNSRRATYGYDQRVEVHGASGMLSAENLRNTTVTLANSQGYQADPLLDFFMQRYADAYRLELTHFVEAVNSGKTPSPSGADGLRALELADAALRSMTSGQRIAV